MSNDLVLLHQVHPLKLGADASAEVISDALLWRHRLAAGLLVWFGLAIIGSSLVLSFADVERLRSSPAGAYVLAHMPPEAMAVRLVGDALMAVGAWRHSPRLLGVGLMVVIAGWSHRLLGPASGPKVASAAMSEETASR
jgi:hypothetical protein